MKDHDYHMRSHPSYLTDAIASISAGGTLPVVTRRESAILRDRVWSQLETDLIRLAAIARRHQIAFRYSSCTIVERLRQGRPLASSSKRPIKERTNVRHHT